jgi:anti-sigma factor (TIGR02949 family)
MMEHNTCRHLKDSLSEYIDGELSAEVCAEIDRHMQECENCRIVVDSLRKTVYLYHTSAKSQDMPEDVRERLFARLDLEDFLDHTL